MDNTKQKVEISDIFYKYSSSYPALKTLHPVQHKAFQDIIKCRSDELGGHIQMCDHCGHTRHAYNSCRNRHCPKCQYIKQVQWVDRLKSKILPVKHFHLVFTIPSCLHTLFYINQAVAYDLLFKASAKALKICAANPKFLGAQTGAVAVLHTWGQTLNYHPHIHMIVPAGGLSEDDMEWIESSKQFFLPVKALSDLFRGILCRLLEGALAQKKMNLPEDYDHFLEIKNLLYKKRWNVYAKKPFAGPDRVIDYLGKYTHRVAISNHRVIAIENDKITIRCKDPKTGKYTKAITLHAHEFIRRFLQHILPKGFYKIRYLGIMALCCMKDKNAQCLELIDKECYLPLLEGLNAIDTFRQITGKDPLLCLACGKGKMKSIPLKLCN